MQVKHSINRVVYVHDGIPVASYLTIRVLPVPSFWTDGLVRGPTILRIVEGWTSIAVERIWNVTYSDRAPPPPPPPPFFSPPRLLSLDTLINMCGGKSFSGFPSRFSAGDTSILGRVILLYQTHFDIYLIKIERSVSFEGENPPFSNPSSRFNTSNANFDISFQSTVERLENINYSLRLK